jgi:hypothetical protein
MVADINGTFKLDVFSATIELELYQKKVLVKAMTNYANDSEKTVYTTYVGLPSTEDSFIESWEFINSTVIIGGNSSETGDIF